MHFFPEKAKKQVHSGTEFRQLSPVGEQQGHEVNGAHDPKGTPCQFVLPKMSYLRPPRPF
jgi:hypothetical protein